MKKKYITIFNIILMIAYAAIIYFNVVRSKETTEYSELNNLFILLFLVVSTIWGFKSKNIYKSIYLTYFFSCVLGSIIFFAAISFYFSYGYLTIHVFMILSLMLSYLIFQIISIYILLFKFIACFKIESIRKITLSNVKTNSRVKEHMINASTILLSIMYFFLLPLHVHEEGKYNNIFGTQLNLTYFLSFILLFVIFLIVKLRLFKHIYKTVLDTYLYVVFVPFIMHITISHFTGKEYQGNEDKLLYHMSLFFTVNIFVFFYWIIFSIKKLFKKSKPISQSDDLSEDVSKNEN